MHKQRHDALALHELVPQYLLILSLPGIGLPLFGSFGYGSLRFEFGIGRFPSNGYQDGFRYRFIVHFILEHNLEAFLIDEAVRRASAPTLLAALLWSPLLTATLHDCSLLLWWPSFEHVLPRGLVWGSLALACDDQQKIPYKSISYQP
jgi:hypothetical protein